MIEPSVVGTRVHNESSLDRCTTPYGEQASGVRLQASRSSQAIENVRSTSSSISVWSVFISGPVVFSAVERVPKFPGGFRGPVG